MDIRMRGSNINITPDLEAYTQERLSKLTRYLPNIQDIYVELKEQKSNRGPDIITAQITLKHSRGAILRTEERCDKVDNTTVRSAISTATDKMYRRIQRFKDKPRSKRQKSRYAMTEEELNLAETLPDEYADPESDIDTNQITRRKQIDVSVMNEEEAIEQMELLGHTFFIFFNGDTDAMNVVYKRRNGDYGLLEASMQ